MIERIQAQLLAGARAGFDAVSIPPFVCFFNPDDASPHANYAMPEAAAGLADQEALAQVRETFQRRGRMPRFEYLEAAAPSLAPLLQDHGYTLEARTYLMVCTPAQLQRPPQPPGFVVRLLGGDAPLSDLQALMTVQGRSFGADDAPAASHDQAAAFRRRFAATRLFLGELAGEPVAAGSLMPAVGGVAEVAGIATLLRYRRRGLAAALTASIAAAAFEQGIDLLFLTAADETAGRVYGRVGFQPAGFGLVYRLEG